MPIVLAYAEPPAVVAPPTPDAPVSMVVTPDWLHKPNGHDIYRVYPAVAARANLSGQAVIRCEVTAKGELANCIAPAEAPSGYGFGEAALKLAPLFKMRPLTREGAPVGGAFVNIPIRFIVTP